MYPRTKDVVKLLITAVENQSIGSTDEPMHSRWTAERALSVTKHQRIKL